MHGRGVNRSTYKLVRTDLRKKHFEELSIVTRNRLLVKPCSMFHHYSSVLDPKLQSWVLDAGSYRFSSPNILDRFLSFLFVFTSFWTLHAIIVKARKNITVNCDNWMILIVKNQNWKSQVGRNGKKIEEGPTLLPIRIASPLSKKKKKEWCWFIVYHYNNLDLFKIMIEIRENFSRKQKS